MPSPYAISLKLAGRLCVVVGGGAVAERKVRTLIASGARITVVAREAGAGIEKLAEDRAIIIHRRNVSEDDVQGNYLVIAATDDHDTNREIAGWARRAGALVNVVDSPEESDFFVPALVQRGDLTIAISTSGKIPALARKIREELEAQFGQEYAQYVALLEEARKRIYASAAVTEPAKLHILGEAAALDLIPLLRDNKLAQARTVLHSFLKQHGIEEAS
jgi:precorrin-2 dehydrogenase/sirohydrochlorin ferrochelatase